MRNCQQGFIGIALIIVLALAAIGGGTYVYMKNVSEIKTPQTEKVETASGSITDTIVEWKEYKNDKYKFSFKYPQELIPAVTNQNTCAKCIAHFSDNKEVDATDVDVSGPYSFPVDTFEGTGDDVPPSKRLNNFEEFTTYYSKPGVGHGVRENIGGFDTFRRDGLLEYNPTLYINIGNNQYLMITISASDRNPSHEQIFKSLMKISASSTTDVELYSNTILSAKQISIGQVQYIDIPLEDGKPKIVWENNTIIEGNFAPFFINMDGVKKEGGKLLLVAKAIGKTKVHVISESKKKSVTIPVEVIGSGAVGAEVKVQATQPLSLSGRLESKAYENSELGMIIHIPKGWKVVEGGYAPVSFFSSNKVDDSEIIMTMSSGPTPVKNLDTLLIKINTDARNALINPVDYKELTLLKSIKLMSGEEAYILNGGQFYGVSGQGLTLISLKGGKEYRVIGEGSLNTGNNKDLILESMSSLKLD